MRFDAFISYSHEADRRLAPVLQSALQKFAKPFYKPSGLKICCDRTDLSTSPGLWSSIEPRLADSRYFLLLASPQAARSPWVARELETWLDLKGGAISRLLIVLTGGQIVWNRDAGDFDWPQTTALPETLRGRLTEEPRFEDARALGDPSRLSIRDPAFQDVIAGLAAEIRGISKRELVGDEIRQQRRQRRFLIVVVAILAALTLTAFYQRRLAVTAAGDARDASAKLAVNVLELADKNAQLNSANTAVAAANRSLTETNVQLQQTATAERRARGLAEQRQFAVEAEMMLNLRPTQLLDSVLLAIRAVSGDQQSPSFDAYQTLERGLSLLPMEIKTLNVGYPSVGFSVSDDGRRLATAAFGHVDVWEIESGRRIASRKMAFMIEDVRLSMNGELVAVAGQDSVAVLEVAHSTRELQTHREFRVREAKRLAISRTGNHVASTNFGRSLRVFATDRENAGWSGSDGEIDAVGFTQDEQLVISGGTTLIEFRSVVGGAVVASCRISKADRVAISRDGTHVAAAFSTGLIQVWHLDPRKLKAPAEPCPNPRQVAYTGQLARLAVSDDGRYVATSSADQTARLWNTTDGREIARASHGPIKDVAFGEPDASFWTSGDDRTVRFWQRPTEWGREQLFHPGPVWTVAFASNGNVVTSDDSGQSRTWLPSSSGSRVRPDPIALAEDGVSFARTVQSADGRVLAMLGATINRERAYISGGNRTSLWVPVVVSDSVAATVANDGRYIATGYPTGELKLVSGSRNRALDHTLMVSDGVGIAAIAFDPESTTVAAGGDDGNLSTWSLTDWRRTAVRNLGAPIAALAFTHDGRRIVAALSSGGIKLLKWPTMAAAGALGVSGTVDVMALSADDRYLAVGNSRGVQVWDVETSRQVAELTHSARILSLAFSQDGRRIAAGAMDNVAVVWFWTPKDLVREGCARLLAAHGRSASDPLACRHAEAKDR